MIANQRLRGKLEAVTYRAAGRRALRRVFENRAQGTVVPIDSETFADDHSLPTTAT
jgi:hypothetical protein